MDCNNGQQSLGDFKAGKTDVVGIAADGGGRASAGSPCVRKRSISGMIIYTCENRRMRISSSWTRRPEQSHKRVFSPRALQVEYFPSLSVLQQYGVAPLPHWFCWLTLVGGGGPGFSGLSCFGGIEPPGAANALPAKSTAMVMMLEKCILNGLIVVN